MSIFKLCNGDPLLVLLRDTFKANPIKMPEERIKPLTVLSLVGKRKKFVGEIEYLLIGNSPIGLQLADSQLAIVSSTKSKSIDTKLGLKIMDGFLKGLGSKAASIEHVFKDATKISFVFQDVHRQYVDLGALMKILIKRKFDIENPVNKMFIDENAKCIVIDSIITSNNFSIKVEDFFSQNFSFDIPEIQKILSAQKNKIGVSSSGKLDISFKGTKYLAFAFTASRLNIDADGSVYFDNEPDVMFLTTIPTDITHAMSQPISFLEDEIGLSEIEFDNSQ